MERVNHPELITEVSNAPIDILLRLAAGNSDTAKGLYFLCPTVREFVAAINRQIPPAE